MQTAPADRSAAWPAASVSAGLHLAALAGLCCVIVRPPPPPQNVAPSFAMVVETQPVEQALTPIQLPPAPAAIAITTPLAIRLPPSVVPAALAGLRTAPHPPRPLAKPAPSFGPAAAPPPQAVAPDTQNILAGLESRIRQAVRDALIYPAAARLLHREGRTRIRFDYTDGTVGAIDIATPSASALLDRAAIAAVRRAALPRAPTEIGNRRLAMLVWVDFRLASQ